MILPILVVNSEQEWIELLSNMEPGQDILVNPDNVNPGLHPKEQLKNVHKFADDNNILLQIAGFDFVQCIKFKDRKALEASYLTQHGAASTSSI